MKILVFSPYYPPHTGGLETHSDEFNKYLSQKGMDITVFTPRLPASAPEKEITHNNVKIVRFPAFEIISNYPVPKLWLPRFWSLFLSLFKKKYGVIFSRTRFFLTSLMALIVAKISRTRWIHIEHGSDFVKLSSSFKNFLARMYDYTFGCLIFRCSDKNISISHAVQRFVQKFDRRFSPIIYRGMDFEMIDSVLPDTSMRQNYPDKIIISTLARLYKWKGIEHTIQAIKSLPLEIKSKVVFNIIGNGEDFYRLQDLAKNEPIQLLGNLERKLALSLLKSSDIYIHSSLPGGGLSTSLLEAMISGCSVVATPYEGADEIVRTGRNGIMVPTPSDISTAIIELFHNKEKRQKFKKNAAIDVRENFSWEKSIKKYLEIIEARKNEN